MCARTKRTCEFQPPQRPFSVFLVFPLSVCISVCVVLSLSLARCAFISYIIMEMAPGGELFDSISKRGRYSENDAAGVLR